MYTILCRQWNLEVCIPSVQKTYLSHFVYSDDDWPLFGLPAAQSEGPWSQAGSTWTHPMGPNFSQASDPWANTETPSWTPMGPSWSSSNSLATQPPTTGYQAPAEEMAMPASPLDHLPASSLGAVEVPTMGPNTPPTGFNPYIRKIWNPIPSINNWSLGPPPKPDDDN